MDGNVKSSYCLRKSAGTRKRNHSDFIEWPTEYDVNFQNGTEMQYEPTSVVSLLNPSVAYAETRRRGRPKKNRESADQIQSENYKEITTLDINPTCSQNISARTPIGRKHYASFSSYTTSLPPPATSNLNAISVNGTLKCQLCRTPVRTVMQGTRECHHIFCEPCALSFPTCQLCQYSQKKRNCTIKSYLDNNLFVGVDDSKRTAFFVRLPKTDKIYTDLTQKQKFVRQNDLIEFASQLTGDDADSTSQILIDSLSQLGCSGNEHERVYPSTNEANETDGTTPLNHLQNTIANVDRLENSEIVNDESISPPVLDRYYMDSTNFNVEKTTGLITLNEDDSLSKLEEADYVDENGIGRSLPVVNERIRYH
ncbi:unnamed protein product [Caenorhabditis bovis]|uniref:RING-type domain-containing protein n=1 Tax=Caenorhabditis bovis TaxID=2654633 RepID=A0A8S1E802_9PELO|nr:unnamed protein product [Caenorhabditis bovis]